MVRGVLGIGLALAGCVTAGDAALPALLATRAAPTTVAKDSDRDGVVDVRDACPQVVGVAPDGCPERDGDGDGYVDRVDRCPDVAGEQDDGCSIVDSDGDGFRDPDDRCPDVREVTNGFADADGCADELPADLVAVTGVLREVRFELDRDQLRPSSRATLDAVAATMARYADVRFEIAAHSDSTAFDLRGDLSRRRAHAVKRYLVEKGIAEDRIETRGARADEPIASNKTAAGRAKNRRVELTILAR